MRCNFLVTLVCVMGVLLTNMKSVDAQTTENQQKTNETTEVGIRFFNGSWKEALAESKKTGKPIFMDCYTKWCVPCKRLATEVFILPEVGNYFNSRFINVKMDMETTEGKALNKEYQVTGYPTLLFMDGDGHILHRIVGAPPVNILLKEGTRVSNGKGYVSMNKEYEAGNRQPAFIVEYMEVLDIAGNGEKAAQVCSDYFKTLDKSKLKEREYWDLFCNYMKDVDSDATKYVYKNREEFAKLFGEKDVKRKLNKLYSGGAYRYWKEVDGNGIFDEKGFEKYACQLMKKDIDSKEQIISDARMTYAMRAKDWTKYVQLGNERMNTGKVNEFTVYNWGLKVNVDCEDMTLREEVAGWMDRIAADCDKKPQNEATISLKKNFQRVADWLRHPEKRDKNYRPTIAITGKVSALRPGEDMIRVIKKEGFFKQTIDSCEVKPDGTYTLNMRVENPGIYILECQGAQRVNFWAGTENVRVNFPGFGNGKFKVVRPIYIHISGGKENEVMNALNWESYQHLQFLSSLSRQVRSQTMVADSVKNLLSSQLSDAVNTNVEDRLLHWAEVYADQESVVALLSRLKDEKYAETVKKIMDNLSKLYPGSMALKNFKEELTQRQLSGQGQMAPEFACPTPDGKKNMGPQDFRGKILVMDFWASWCGPCRKEIPHLKEAYAKYADKGVAFFSVSIDKDGAAWKKALGEENMPWEQVCAPQAGKDVMKLYQFSGIPYVLVLDKDGRISGTNLRGQALMDKLEEMTNGTKPKGKSSMRMR